MRQCWSAMIANAALCCGQALAMKSFMTLQTKTPRLACPSLIAAELLSWPGILVIPV